MLLKKIMFALLFSSSLAYAADDVTKFMQQSANMKVIREFKGPSNLIGLVIEQGGEYSIMFATPDKKTLIAGILMDVRGNNLTADYAMNEIPKQSAKNTSIQQLSKASIIKTGAIKPKVSIYAVFRPTCSMCHMFYRLSKQYDGLEIKWIPIAINEDEAKVIDTIFTAQDKSKALIQWFETGTTLQNASVENGNKISADNTALLKEYNVVATPTLIYTGKDGNVYSKGGLPKLKEFNAITGIVPKPITDTQLKQMLE